MSTITTPTVTGLERPRLELSRHARGAYRAMSALDGAIELDSSLRDLVSLRASILNGCAYCVDMHTLDAAKRGESAQRLYAVAAWHEAPFFSERERAALQLTATLIADGQVPRAVYDTARQHFDEEEFCQLLWAITAINAWNRVALATRMLPGEYTPD